jgi:hypothetical protein
MKATQMQRLKRVITASFALLHLPLVSLYADENTQAPTSVEIWIPCFPKGASNEAVAPREPWTLYVDDLRLTQAIDAQGGKSLTLVGPDVDNGDFERGENSLNGYLLRSWTTVTATDQTPAASGKKFVALVADPNVQRYFPRAIKYLGMPDLNRGRYFVLSAKVRAKEKDGMVGAALSMIFKDKDRRDVKAYHGPRVAVTPDRWVEVKLEFDYDRGISLWVTDREQAAEAAAQRAKWLEYDIAAQRAKWPEYDITPRKDDGKNLALSVAKWEGRAGIPGKPFRVWAIGASWTAVRERFPKAPPIEFKSHAGSGCPWNYARGWVSQFVLADQPDLIITYTHGDLEMLDAMLSDIRRHSTADIIVPSLHLMGHEDGDFKNRVEWFQAGYGFSLKALEDVCRKHGVEYVQNRHELARYLTGIGKTPNALLSDAAHQNEHGLVRTWDNIVRHLAKPKEFNYAPESRERRISVASATKTATESLRLSSGWKIDEGVALTAIKGERITVRFTGNRIDLLGRSRAGGGKARVKIDGASGETAPVFYMTAITPRPVKFPYAIAGPGPGDVGPHGVSLGERVVPQAWTITSTSDEGDYRLEGSATGADGEGNSTRSFTSRSGQIRIDPSLWRYNRDGKEGQYRYGNRTGDQYTFEVYRCAVGEVSFAPAGGSGPGFLHQALVQNLSNGSHELTIETLGDGEVAIESFYVYQPPER